MRLPRFSIASILADIAIFAVALAALRSPSYLWANVTFSLALGALVVAIINAIYGRDADRAYWFGFSLCGGIYLAVCSMPGLRESVCPRLVTEVILDFLYPHLSPEGTASSGVTFIATTNTVTGLQVMPGSPTWTFPTNVAYVQTTPSPPVPPSVAWTEPDRTIGGTVSLSSSEAFRRIGHSMFTLLVAVLGGMFARHRYRNSIMNRPGSEAAA
jgi:hypothetical protein